MRAFNLPPNPFPRADGSAHTLLHRLRETQLTLVVCPALQFDCASVCVCVCVCTGGLTVKRFDLHGTDCWRALSDSGAVSVLSTLADSWPSGTL